MKSILTEDNEHCFICASLGIEQRKQCVHHIFFGALRKTSERNGFTVPLCNRHHNMSDNSVHFDREMDIRLKRLCQKKYEETHSRDEFMELIGRNYLD